MKAELRNRQGPPGIAPPFANAAACRRASATIASKRGVPRSDALELATAGEQLRPHPELLRRGLGLVLAAAGIVLLA